MIGALDGLSRPLFKKKEQKEGQKEGEKTVPKNDRQAPPESPGHAVPCQHSPVEPMNPGAMSRICACAVHKCSQRRPRFAAL